MVKHKKKSKSFSKKNVKLGILILLFLSILFFFGNFISVVEEENIVEHGVVNETNPQKISSENIGNDSNSVEVEIQIINETGG